MLPLLMLGAGVWAWHRHRTHKQPSLPAPALARLHGDMMGREFNPIKLEKAADILRQNGAGPQARELKYKASEIRKQAKVIPDLVECARAPDQNAIAMIAGVRENAAKGDPRAIVSANLIAKYCERHPAKQLGPLGEAPQLPGY